MGTPFFIGSIVFYTQLGLKIGARLNERMKIKFEDITFQNFLKCPWLSKMKKNNGLPISLSFSLPFLSLFILYTFLSHINWWDHVN